MSHHGWIQVLNADVLTPDGLKAPFGRLFPSQDNQYDSLAVSMLAGPMGPLQDIPPSPPTPPSTDEANPTGFTFFGQFVDHDLTEFRVIGDSYALIPQNPVIGQRQRVLEDVRGVTDGRTATLPTTTNGRTGKLDLDSVYGLLGAAQPDLFDERGLFRMRVETGMAPDIMRGDAFRNKRLIADPRNDENKLIVQIHLLFERLHNAIHGAKISKLTSAGKAVDPQRFGPTGDEFEATKASVQSAYRSIVLHDYLPRIIARPQIVKILDMFASGQTFFQAMNKRNDALLAELGLADAVLADAVAIPVEFSHAAFRLGHTQLRDNYLLRDSADARVPLFNTARNGNDLRGDQPLFKRNDDGTTFDFHVDWKLFFKRDAARDPDLGQPIDGKLPASIFRLPPPAIGEPPQSLPERNIRRGVDFGLPSGQAAAGQFAKLYGFIQPMSNEALFPSALFGLFKEVLVREPRLQWDTPLWYYVIQEAATVANAPVLGDVGGYIVGETIIGAMLEAEVRSDDNKARPALIAARAKLAKTRFNDIPADWHETSSGPRAWNAVVTDAAAITSMSQLIGFVQSVEAA